MSSAKCFINGINRTFSNKGGILWEYVTDAQIRKFIIKEMDEFHARPEGNGKKKKFALIIGKQPGSVVYVFSENVQVNILIFLSEVASILHTLQFSYLFFGKTMK